MSRFFIVLALWNASLILHAQNTPASLPPETPAEFSVWSQRLDLSRYIGKKYRLTAAIRAEGDGPESFAIAFIRNEPPAGGLRSWTYMDNMMDRPVRDTLWKVYTLQYVVDQKAPWIAFGVLAYGSGKFYYDDLQLAVEESPDKWTPISIPNGDFEQEGIDPWQQTAQGVPVRTLGAQATLDAERAFNGRQCLRIMNRFLSQK